MAKDKRAGNAEENESATEGIEQSVEGGGEQGSAKGETGVTLNEAGQVVRKEVNGRFEHALFTVNCPRDSDPKGLKRVPISIDGTHPDGSSFQYIATIQRGVNVPNVPYCALAVLANAIETRYWTEERADRSGHELKKESGPSYPFAVIEGPYWKRK